MTADFPSLAAVMKSKRIHGVHHVKAVIPPLDRAPPTLLLLAAAIDLRAWIAILLITLASVGVSLMGKAESVPSSAAPRAPGLEG